MAVFMELPGRELAALALRIVIPLSLLFLLLIFTLQHVTAEGIVSVFLMSVVWTLAAGAIVYSFVLDGRERARLSELWMSRSFLRR